ncbi:tetratricopeptide repeat protein [Thalassoroseus pseudoceratinae]|uniref:tetratricopeptide repeat protein n=1 Tax=Thalassoroseus pseudoceratinae TaxID=2713176 RepID=UPI001420684E|nr:hypothetical protein [Thalassoroseus pseudoceratinae]
MRFSNTDSVNWSAARKAVRHLVAAEGYLELELPGRALAELECIPHNEETTDLQPFVHYLTGESLKDLERFEEAIDPLHEAARTMPAPYNRTVWTSLGECFRRDGQPVLAEVAEMFAEMNPELVESESMFGEMDGCEENAEFDMEAWEASSEDWGFEFDLDSLDDMERPEKPRFDF